MIQSKTPAAGAILSRISVILSLAAHFSINEASPVGNPFPEDMIPDSTLEGISRSQSTPPNPNALSNVEGSLPGCCHFSTSPTPSNINHDPLFATLQGRLVPQRDAAPAFHDFTGSSHHFSYLQEYDRFNHVEDGHLSASNAPNHILEKQSLYYTTDGLQTSRDWIPSPGYEYDRDWIQDFGWPITPETMSEDTEFYAADDNLWDRASWKVDHSVVAGSGSPATHKADRPSREICPITLANNADAVKYNVASDILVPATSVTSESKTDKPRGEHDSGAIRHQDRSRKEGQLNSGITGTSATTGGLGPKHDYTGVLLDAQRFLERQHHAGNTLFENPSPSLAGSVEPPGEFLSNNMNDADGSMQSRKRKANKVGVKRNPQGQRKLDRLGPSRSALPNTALDHSREQEAIKSNSDQDLQSARAGRRPRKKKSAELLKEKSSTVAQYHPSNSLTKTSSLCSGGSVENPGDLSTQDPNDSHGLQLSKNQRYTKPAGESSLRVPKGAGTLSVKSNVMRIAASRMRKDQEDLKAHVNLLENVTKVPVKLLANGNFNANKALSCLLADNRLPAQNQEGNQITLVSYLKSYKICYRSKSWIKYKSLKKTKQKAKRTFRRAENKKNSNVQYIAGGKRFTGTEMGNSVENLEIKWLNLILESYPIDPSQKWKVVWGWYEFVKRSTTCLLYQIELLFRLSIPISGFTETDKDLALKNVLKNLDALWSNFPFQEVTQDKKQNSSEFFYEGIVDDIKYLRKECDLIPAFFEVTKLLFSNWYMRQNSFAFEKLKEVKRKLPKTKRVKRNFIGHQLFYFFQDCAWIDYMSMQDLQTPAGIDFPFQSGLTTTSSINQKPTISS